MNRTLTIALVAIGGLVLSALIFGAGMFVDRAYYGTAGNGSYSMMGNQGSMMGGSGMMGNGISGMMGNGNGSMMGNGNSGMMGNGNGGMMGGYRSGGASNIKPLTVDQARQAVESYLTGLKNSDLEIKEIMVFDNNAYARITEKSTGIGAMELLVDPATLSVFPEYGPNMMWNLKYGMMSSYGMMGNSNGMMGNSNGMMGNSNGMMGSSNGMMGNSGGMMGGIISTPGSVSADMTVTPEQALQAAQQYLDQQYPGYKTAEDADPFYGYYTIDILKDGKTEGMLSVNGFTSQVFFHAWHGTFIESFE